MASRHFATIFFSGLCMLFSQSHAALPHEYRSISNSSQISLQALPSDLPNSDLSIEGQFYQYWFDSDFDSNNWTIPDDGNIDISISLENLSPGLHCFNFRPSSYVNSDLEYGAITRSMFYYAPELGIPSEAAAGYETWFDSDYANRVFTKSTDTDIVLSLSLQSLAPGLHTFNFRAVGDGDSQSGVLRSMFYYAPELAVNTSQIAGYETWFDNDYAHSTLTPYDASDIVITLDISSLSPGLHAFNYRSIGMEDAYAEIVRKIFYVIPEETTYAVSCRYWIDDEDPSEIDVLGDALNLDIDIADLAQGDHILYVQPVATDGSLGKTYSQPFCINGSELEAAEWTLLQALYVELGQMGWVAPWNMLGGPAAAGSFEGIKIQDGHITGFDFSDKSLAGVVPKSMFAFPELKSIDLSYNKLSGPVDSVFALLATTQPSAVAKIESLNLSHNYYKGNVGILAYPLSALNSLDVSYNGFADIYPAISPNVKKLNFGHQTITDRVVVLDFTSLNLSDIEALQKTIPSITLYNHPLQTWLPSKAYVFTTADPATFQLGVTEEWTVAVAFSELGLMFPYVSPEFYVFYGDNGSTFNSISAALAPISENPDDGYEIDVEGTNFKIQIFFSPGDVNFDTDVNALDLQSIVNYIFEIYKNKPFNFTAANLREDDVINIQDCVVMVNLLLGKLPATQSRADDEIEVAYNAGGLLCISAAKDVAAFELTLHGDDNVRIYDSLARMGFICETAIKGEGYTRVVAYSLSGATLPAGVTAIGEIGNSQVVSAVLADTEANAIKQSAENTSITNITTADTNISFDGHNISIISDCGLTNVDWNIATVDGIVIDSGHIPALASGINNIECTLPASGFFIVTIESDQFVRQSRKIMIVNP